ncbi:MAG TPA: NAD(P)-dependent oxidoreductase [Armatimonadota bacterium]|nr:NAD(P)-dependent oxidoreductase [Armatimonadota bacterium]
MIFLTGGHGLLGTELRKLRDYIAPEEHEMDITDLPKVIEVVKSANPSAIYHCAAYTNVTAAETDWKRCYEVNAIGTHNMVEAAKAVGAVFIYMSTDYVFDGDQEPGGPGYKPDDIPHPINWYATTKLIGEVYTQAYPDYYIIRTSFKRSPWEHPKAVADMWTTADYVDVIAPLIDKTIGRIIEGKPLPGRIIHLGTPRKSILELARRRSPDIEAITRADVSVRLPVDTSLCCFEP